MTRLWLTAATLFTGVYLVTGLALVAVLALGAYGMERRRR